MFKKRIFTIISLISLLTVSAAFLPNTNAVTVQAAKKTKYAKSKITLPKGYTKSALLKAYAGKPSKSFITASMKGMDQNSFSRTSAAESAKDNKTKINPAKLTASQQKTLTNYALRLINGACAQLRLPKWKYSKGTQKLAVDIAKEYQTHGRSIKNKGHYVAGIVRACKKNGLNLNDNYVEDMAGFSIKQKTMTMTQMKKNIYFGLKQMIFGYAGSGESCRKSKKNYREWEHACDLFNLQNSRHDGDFDYFGFSISKTKNIYSMHYIGIPSFVVKSKEYNLTFKP